MITREHTKEFNIGNKKIGKNNPILIQTMSDIKTSDVENNIKLIDDCVKLGCDMIRFSVLDEEDCKALKEIKQHSKIPVIADIHFNYMFAIKALEANFDKIRINPGNFSYRHLDELIEKLIEKNSCVRIGVNSGSLGKYEQNNTEIAKQFFNAVDEMLLPFKNKNFEKIVISCKHSNPNTTKLLYELIASHYDYPLHLGVTESGYGINGAIKTCVGLIPLLNEGLGNTIRISLSDSPQDEIVACKTLLGSLNLKKDIPTLISCPTCGRTQVNVKKFARLVEEKLKYVNKNISVAVMGCPVNGPGEAKNADIGIAGGKNTFTLFRKGKVIATYEQEQALKEVFNLLEHIENED